MLARRNITLKSAAVSAALLAVGLIAASCGSTSAASPTTTTTKAKTTATTSPYMTPLQEQVYYMAVLTPEGNAMQTWQTQAKAWTAYTPTPVVVSDTEPLIKAIGAAMSQLKSGKWQPKTVPDIDTFVKALGAMQKDFQALGTVSSSSANALGAQLSKDVAAGLTAENLVRTDIGMAPASTQTTAAG